MNDWWERAACKGKDPAIFVIDKGQSPGPAKAICAGCSVRDQCLAWAIENRETGVWGGTSGEERRRYRRMGTLRTKTCVECRAEFQTVNHRMLMCSDQCRERRHRRQHEESRRRLAPTEEERVAS